MYSKTLQKGQRIYRLCLLCMYGSLMFTLKMAMASLPNIEPVSAMVILAAVCFGKSGILSVLLYVACEILIWGPGWWNLCYLYVWPLLFGLGLLFRKIRSPLFWACLSSVFGFSFGALCALLFGLMNGWNAGFVWWQNGIGFDLLHGAGNFCVTLFVFEPLRLVLERLLAGSRYTPRENRHTP